MLELKFNEKSELSFTNDFWPTVHVPLDGSVALGIWDFILSKLSNAYVWEKGFKVA